ncbi:MAG: hypothetical protein JO018_03360 [Candidatus Eremiobacteraeota bacterium]|nr:hypothetical protein [Candidatus Eremiobacteraeota bacterium]
MNLKPILVSGVLVLGSIAGVASAQTVSNSSTNVAKQVAQAYYTPRPPRLRGERGSARNIYQVRIRLERLIDQLQRDQHDYGGYRQHAIDLMQQARQQLLLAEQWDLQHPGSAPIR